MNEIYGDETRDTTIPSSDNPQDQPTPSPMPTSAPSPMPASAPSPMPASAPSPMPTSAPSPMPTSAHGSTPATTRSRRFYALFSAAIVVFPATTYAGGYLLGEHHHSASIVDQAIERVSNGDPHSPTEILLQRAAIEAVLKATRDKWSNYFPPASASAFDATLQGRYSGIGIWVRKNPQGLTEVSSVQVKSPAAASGIKVRDLLVSVNGLAVSSLGIAETIAALRGDPNTDVSLKLLRGSQTIAAVIKRASILSGDVLASQIAPKTIYIQVSAISLHSAADVVSALAKYPHSHGIILDLRDNPGGVLSEAVTLASTFLSPGPIVSYDRKDGAPQVMQSSNINPETAPMVVLINESTASSAEIIAGALQDRNRAVIIGSQSYGKGTVQEISTLSDGSQLEITVGQYHLPSGRAIDQVGITPDLKVSESQDLPKAISILEGLVALDSGKTVANKK